jgi:toxin ParE1/3/4
MADYRLSNEAKNDLIRIHQYGIKKFGVSQADKYFHAFFDCFDDIGTRPFSFESVDYIKHGYRRCVCGVDSIYFKINKGVVEIMAIIGKQDLDNIF